MSIWIYNDIEQICVGCECIVASEREEAYNFMIKFMLRYAPCRRYDKIYVISEYGLFYLYMFFLGQRHILLLIDIIYLYVSFRIIFVNLTIRMLKIIRMEYPIPILTMNLSNISRQHYGILVGFLIAMESKRMLSTNFLMLKTYAYYISK